MDIIQNEKNYILQVYKRYPLVLVRGKGKYVWDEQGKRYLDFFSGLSVCNVGHCHPRVVSAVKRQAAKLMHVSNLYYTEPQVALAARLVERTFPGKVFLSNSGAEANECAIKLARKWGKQTVAGGDMPDRYEIVTFLNSFHGRTLATLSATGQKKFHKGFEPLLNDFPFAEFNDLGSVERLLNEKTVAVLVEPVQGEGGVHVATKEFLQGLRTLCDHRKLLLIVDEIQSGMGRTGSLFAWQRYGVKPDIITSAKSLAGGLPLGATIVSDAAAQAFNAGDHGSTFGGNLVSCAAAIEVLSILDPALLEKVDALGNYFMFRLAKLARKYPFIKAVRGLGLMTGLELTVPGRDIVTACLDKGLLINCTQETVLRFLPPLIINRNDIRTAVGILDEALSEIHAA